MKKLITFGLTMAILASSFGVGQALATYGDTTYGGGNCQPVYGGGTTCETTNRFTLDKKVMNPSTNAFVDNLTVNDPKFGPNQTVTFQLTVKNTGNVSLNELTLTDIMPSYLTFVSGPGAFDTNSKTLTFKVFNLNPNETRNFTVVAKTADGATVPTAGVCVVNQASLVFGNDISKDNSQFCIQNQALGTTSKGGFPVMSTPPVKSTPATGPEMIPLFGLIPAGLSGLFLRKRASK